MTPTSRRLARAAGALVTATALAGSLAACGSAQSSGSAASGAPSAASSAPAGPFEFTDDRGKKISLPVRPKRIVAQVHAAAALWDFGIKPIGVFGPQRNAGGSPDAQVGNVDLNAVTSIGAQFGEFNLEKYASVQPDLVVTIMYGPQLWYIPQDSQEKIEKLAPVVGIRLDGKSVPEVISKFGELARSLGADLDASSVKQAKEGFDKASADLKAAAKEKAGLKVEVAIGEKDSFWVADPKWHGDLKYLSELGLDIVAPTAANPAYGFETLSWEQAAKYPADLILEDARAVGMTPDELAAKFPTWKQLAAVNANQVAPWRAETPSSYLLYTKVLTELSQTVRNARTDVVA